MHFHTYEERYFSWTFVFFSLKSCVPLHTDYPMTRYDRIPQRAYFILILTCVTQSANLGWVRFSPSVWWRYGISRSCDEWCVTHIFTNFIKSEANIFYTEKKLLRPFIVLSWTDHSVFFYLLCQNLHRIEFSQCWWMYTFLNAAQFLVGASVYNVFTTILS